MINFESSETTSRVISVFKALVGNYMLKSEEYYINLMNSVSEVLKIKIKK